MSAQTCQINPRLMVCCGFEGWLWAGAALAVAVDRNIPKGHQVGDDLRAPAGHLAVALHKHGRGRPLGESQPCGAALRRRERRELVDAQVRQRHLALCMHSTLPHSARTPPICIQLQVLRHVRTLEIMGHPCVYTSAGPATHENLKDNGASLCVSDAVKACISSCDRMKGANVTAVIQQQGCASTFVVIA